MELLSVAKSSDPLLRIVPETASKAWERVSQGAMASASVGHSCGLGLLPHVWRPYERGSEGDVSTELVTMMVVSQMVTK